jgi:hypothetical protein
MNTKTDYPGLTSEARAQHESLDIRCELDHETRYPELTKVSRRTDPTSASKRTGVAAQRDSDSAT